MKIKQLLAGIEILQSTAEPELDCIGVSYDSRRSRPGDLFVALVGYTSDGHDYIAQAVEQGAICVLCQRPPQGEIPYIQVADSRRVLAMLGANFYGHPAREMTMVAVTGTNGKTTSTYLLRDILMQALGAKVGLIGTNQNMIGQQVLPAERTTPESFALQGLFRQMAEAGCSHVVMEVSSHALALDRVWGVDFSVGIFTNLSQDHLDFHQSMEAYCQAKAILFDHCDTGIYNADDPWSERLLAKANCRKISFAVRQPAMLRGENLRLAADHLDFEAVSCKQRAAVHLGIPGGFNVYNALGVLAAAQALGISLAQSAAILQKSSGVCGRVEVVPTPGRDYTILIDYAHSPDGLENVLSSVRGFARGRTVVLFGCGGDRDRGKRPQMGAIAARLSDFVIVTTDNPRTEEPQAIIADILSGMQGSKTPCAVIENRIEAIHFAMDNARPEDVIVLCGKGHENYQIIGTEKQPLNEREVVAVHLAASR